MALKLIHQRDGTPFYRSNCGCVATAHAIAWATGNKVRRKPNQIRLLLDGRWSGPGAATALKDQSRAWEKLRRAARRRGLELSDFDIQPTKPWAGVLKALRTGNAVLLQIDNKTLNDRAQPLSGFPGFSGLHVIVITELRTKDGRIELLDYDGGYDGRIDSQTGTRVPRGPQWVPEDVLKAAAEAKNVISWQGLGLSEAAARERSAGTATFAVVRPATVIDKGGEGGGKGGHAAGPVDPPVTGANAGTIDPVHPGPVAPADPPEEEEPEEDPDPPTADVAHLRAALKRLNRRITQLEAENDQLADENANLGNALDIIQTLLATAKPGDRAVEEASAEIDRTLPPQPNEEGETLDIGVGDEL